MSQNPEHFFLCSLTCCYALTERRVVFQMLVFFVVVFVFLFVFPHLSQPTTIRSTATEQLIPANKGLKLSQTCHKETEKKKK